MAVGISVVAGVSEAGMRSSALSQYPAVVPNHPLDSYHLNPPLMITRQGYTAEQGVGVEVAGRSAGRML